MHNMLPSAAFRSEGRRRFYHMVNPVGGSLFARKQLKDLASEFDVRSLLCIWFQRGVRLSRAAFVSLEPGGHERMALRARLRVFCTHLSGQDQCGNMGRGVLA